MDPLLSYPLSDDYKGLTDLLIDTLDSDILAVSICQVNHKGCQASARDVKGLFKALFLMTNHV